jgi:hypothetical protein
MSIEKGFNLGGMENTGALNSYHKSRAHPHSIEKDI